MPCSHCSGDLGGALPVGDALACSHSLNRSTKYLMRKRRDLSIHHRDITEFDRASDLTTGRRFIFPIRKVPPEFATRQVCMSQKVDRFDAQVVVHPSVDERGGVPHPTGIVVVVQIHRSEGPRDCCRGRNSLGKSKRPIGLNEIQCVVTDAIPAGIQIGHQSSGS